LGGSTGKGGIGGINPAPTNVRGWGLHKMVNNLVEAYLSKKRSTREKRKQNKKRCHSADPPVWENWQGVGVKRGERLKQNRAQSGAGKERSEGDEDVKPIAKNMRHANYDKFL